MKKVVINNKTLIELAETYEAKPLERKLAEIMTTKEPIEATSPVVYTEKKDGVLPQFDIRTDRWEIAREAMEIVSKTAIAKREGVSGKTESVDASSGATTE